jgi:hypothetical protein
VAGQFAGDRDRDDRAAFAAPFEVIGPWRRCWPLVCSLGTGPRKAPRLDGSNVGIAATRLDG